MRASRLVFSARKLVVLLLVVLLPTAAHAQERARVEIIPGIGHTGEIAAAAFSPDGTRVLSADRYGTMKLWEAESGRLLQSFAGEPEYSPKVVFSRDGTVAVSLRSTSLTLWNVATGQAIRTIEKLPIRTTSVAFAPDGKSVLVGATNGTAQLRDLESGRITQVFQHIHASASGNISVAFSPDGTLVLTGGGRGGRDKAADDRRVKVWEAATGRLVRAFGEFGEYSDEVELAVSPDGARVAVADHQYDVVQIWDIATGKGLKALAGRRPPDGGVPDWRAMQFVAFSRDGTVVTSGGLGWVRGWDANTGDLVHILGEESMQRSEHGYFHAVSPDGTRAVSGGLTPDALGRDKRGAGARLRGSRAPRWRSRRVARWRARAVGRSRRHVRPVGRCRRHAGPGG
jgi:WD40 repeat protein